MCGKNELRAAKFVAPVIRHRVLQLGFSLFLLFSVDSEGASLSCLSFQENVDDVLARRREDNFTGISSVTIISNLRNLGDFCKDTYYKVVYSIGAGSGSSIENQNGRKQDTYCHSSPPMLTNFSELSFDCIPKCTGDLALILGGGRL